MNHTLSINIEQGINENFRYIVTPNATQVVGNIVSFFQSGTHSFTIAGTYGTGKSSFIIAVEQDLKKKNDWKLIPNIGQFNGYKNFEFLNIVGDYTTLMRLVGEKIGYESTFESKNFFKVLDSYYKAIYDKEKFLVIVIDEFGKILEHTANNNPEKELYFIQQFAEYVNDSKKNILFLTTLHQNFGAYARKLTDEQRNEWTKVKGRFQEVVFVEPIEQLLYLATEQLSDIQKNILNEPVLAEIYNIAQKTRYINNTLLYDTVKKLYPMDIFAAVSLTIAIQRYGQNERSLFSFLNSNQLGDAKIKATKTYNLSDAYNYITYNFYTFLSEANADSMNWRAMRVALERTEAVFPIEQMNDAINIVKAIGLLNLFGSASVSVDRESLCQYAKLAMDIDNPESILKELEGYKIIRYANYKNQFILFEGTDINIEHELLEAAKCVPRPATITDDIKLYFENRIVPVIASFYKTGTPRYFEYSITNEAIIPVPIGDTDGYINLVFPLSLNYTEQNIIELSVKSECTVYVYFNNTQDIIKHLYEIEKLKYVREHTLGDNTDKVAIKEIENMLAYEKTLLNKDINESLISYSDNVTWIYKGQIEPVRSLSEFNKLLSKVCDTAYPQTPIMKNELFNKQKLSSAIATAKGGYMQALLDNSDKEDIGFPQDKFPPEKTIYYSLLKNTGIHRVVEGEFYTLGEPTTDDLKNLWDTCETFLQNTIEKKQKLGDLVKILLKAPIKLKQGFIDYWLPTYLLIRKQDFSLFDSRDTYVPDITREVLDILQKNPNEFSIKKFTIDGVKLDFFNQYRKFINLNDEEFITSESFIKTIKPFLAFYKRLNDYAKNTQKFDSPKTAKFRDVLANAKDPEKTFFEDLPHILGFKDINAKNEKFLEQYQDLISNAIKDLRLCYDNLINRIEKKVISDLGLHSKEFQTYIVEIQERYKHIKQHLLTQKQLNFHNRLLSPADNKKAWYQSICFVVLNKPLDRLRDEEEELLIENVIFLFREIEKYADISEIADKDSKDEIFKFEMVSTNGTIRPQAYRLPETQKGKVENLENKINSILSGDNVTNIIK